jgi:hypothetical protein
MHTVQKKEIRLTTFTVPVSEPDLLRLVRNRGSALPNFLVFFQILTWIANRIQSGLRSETLIQFLSYRIRIDVKLATWHVWGRAVLIVPKLWRCKKFPKTPNHLKVLEIIQIFRWFAILNLFINIHNTITLVPDLFLYRTLQNYMGTSYGTRVNPYFYSVAFKTPVPVILKNTIFLARFLPSCKLLTNTFFLFRNFFDRLLLFFWECLPVLKSHKRISVSDPDSDPDPAF